MRCRSVFTAVFLAALALPAHAVGQTAPKDEDMLFRNVVLALTDHLKINPQQLVLDTTRSGRAFERKAYEQRPRVVQVAWMLKQAESLGFRVGSTLDVLSCFHPLPYAAPGKCEHEGAEVAAEIQAPTIHQDSAVVRVSYARKRGPAHAGIMRFEFVRRRDRWEFIAAVLEMVGTR